jgi:Ca2+-binding RTX toxin-like protein
MPSCQRLVHGLCPTNGNYRPVRSRPVERGPSARGERGDLTLTGSSAINDKGKALDTILPGNTGATTLNGSSGHDALDGGDGLDTLTGCSRADTPSSMRPRHWLTDEAALVSSGNPVVN